MEKKMPDENIQAVVDNALVDNATEMRAALYNAINDKIFDALEQRKQEMARNFISQYDSDNEEESEEQEEESAEEEQEEDTEDSEETQQ
jgi:DNA-directed RNA polymerase specialized sigma24 family protein